MLTFLQFIKEAVLIHDISEPRDMPIINSTLDKTLDGIKDAQKQNKLDTHLVKTEKLDDDHSLMHFNTSQGKLYTVMKNGRSTLALSTSKKGASEDIDELAKHESNTFPPHKLYHHLITKYDKILTSNTQTPGGLHVWQQLSKMPGVNTHGWDTSKSRVVNTDKFLRHPEETHFDYEEFRTSNNRDYEKDHGDLKYIELVAHKK